jgi:hypothetical protein
MSTIDVLENEYYLFSHCRGEYFKIEDEKCKQQTFVERIEAIITGKSKKYLGAFEK